jgi:DNA-binding MarR family transcriptional regulator
VTETLIGYELKRAQQALRGATDEALRPLGLTTPQYAALNSVQSEPGASSATLARRSFVTPQTMNDIVNLLTGTELLEKEPHPEHKRIVQLRLTKKGEAVLEHAHQAILRVEERMIAPLTEAERKQLAQCLRACSEALTSS